MTTYSLEGRVDTGSRRRLKTIYILSADDGAGVIPATSNGVTVAEYGSGVIHKSVFTLSGVSVTMTDATTAGCHGSIKLADLPVGLIKYIGGTASLTIARVGTAISATAAVVASVGSVTTATDNAALTTTEADLIPSTAAPLTAGVGAVAGKYATAAGAILDGTSTPVDFFLNFAIPDADCTGSDALTVNGTVTLVWANLGDV